MAAVTYEVLLVAEGRQTDESTLDVVAMVLRLVVQLVLVLLAEPQLAVDAMVQAVTHTPRIKTL